MRNNEYLYYSYLSLVFFQGEKTIIENRILIVRYTSTSISFILAV